jgi:hypothetical protein
MPTLCHPKLRFSLLPDIAINRPAQSMVKALTDIIGLALHTILSVDIYSTSTVLPYIPPPGLTMPLALAFAVSGYNKRWRPH